jgi:hypothetical protein
MASSIPTCSSIRGKLASTSTGSPRRSGACRWNPRNGTRPVTTIATFTSPKPLECSRSGGAL